MNIEAGKTYRTRSGKRVFVAAVLPAAPNGYRPTLPVVAYLEGICGFIQLNLDGTYSGIVTPHHWDLVEEWREPRTKTEHIAWYIDSWGRECVTPVTDKFPSPYVVKVLARKTITLTEGEGVEKQ